MTSIDNGSRVNFGAFQELTASELTGVDGGLLQAVVGFFLVYSWEKALDGIDGGKSLAEIAGYK